MAQHIKIGLPVNAAEQWAFDFLKENLPDNYYLITNVEVYDDKGHPFEVDAVVVGEFAVYMVDVKGYRGKLTASKDVWMFNGRKVDNPISKLNGNARILASRCRKILAYGQHAPWCQATVFITGGEGGDVDIDLNGHSELPVFSKDNVIDALTKPEYLSSHYSHTLKDYQRDIALKALCDFKLLQKQTTMLAGYSKETLLLSKGALETWLVQPIDNSLSFDYWMKLVDLTSCSAVIAEDWRKHFKQEYSLLSQLADIPEVPVVLSHWDDGENLALVHSAVYGTRISDSLLEGKPLLAAIRAVATALVMFADKGLVCTNLNASNIFVSSQGVVTFADILPLFDSVSDSEVPPLPLEAQLSEIFTVHLLTETLDGIYKPNETCSSIDGLDEWLISACNTGNALPPLSDLLELLEPKAVAGEIRSEVIEADSLVVGDVIAGKYELLSCIGRGATSTVWRAKHLLGDYECSMKILKDIDGADEFARKEFEILRSSYHPNIIRIFDLDRLPGSETYYMIGQFINGQTLCEVDKTEETDIWSYFRDVLAALQYLHRINILHKDIKPQNIVIDSERAYLIDFNLSSLDSLLIGTMSYKDPKVKEQGWSKFSDIYALVVSFIEVATGSHPFIQSNELPNCDDIIALPEVLKGISDKTRNRLQQVLNHQVDLEAIPDYLAWFGLSDTVDVSIPKEFKDKWNVREGYMQKALVSLIADDQARSRTVIINNILKANKLVGNKTNRGSISAAISSLKNSGIVEYHGKKVRLTNDFKEGWKLNITKGD